MAEVKWHIISEEGNPAKPDDYLVTHRNDFSDGDYHYYATMILHFEEGWNCHRPYSGDIQRDHEDHDVYAWAELDHLYDGLPSRKKEVDE